MRTLRVVTWVALATGLTFVVGEASAQYYPSGPAYPAPRMAQPVPVDVDDPDYAPPPPPYYGPRPPAAVYPAPAAPEPYGQQRYQAAPPPAPAAGTNFPPPADYPWVRERGGYAAAPPAPAPGGPYPNQGGPYPQSGHIMSDQPDVPRPPAQVDTGITGSIGPNNGTAVASLPADIRPEEGAPTQLPPQFRRQIVAYPSTEPAGTIIIDTPNTYLYLVMGHGQAMRYGVGVGREGFTWTGTEKITKMAQWPDWFPPKEMIERQPYLPRFMAGGPSNPLGARALYLGRTVYRIHGTNQPSTIGSFVSSGCIRLVNEDIEDLYTRVQVGTRVVVLPAANQPAAAATGPTTAVR